LFTLFDGLEGFDVELFAVEADCCVVIAAVVDQSCVWVEIEPDAVV